MRLIIPTIATPLIDLLTDLDESENERRDIRDLVNIENIWWTQIFYKRIHPWDWIADDTAKSTEIGNDEILLTNMWDIKNMSIISFWGDWEIKISITRTSQI